MLRLLSEPARMNKIKPTMLSLAGGTDRAVQEECRKQRATG